MTTPKIFSYECCVCLKDQSIKRGWTQILGRLICKDCMGAIRESLMDELAGASEARREAYE